jgi:uncharacterized protein
MTPSPPRGGGGGAGSDQAVGTGAGSDTAARAGAGGARRDDGGRRDADESAGGPWEAAARLDAAARRDRDAAGRPRNARPRDELGRPLSRDAAGEPPLDDEAVLPPADALALAQQLIDDGRPFRAHEVLEASWKSAPAAERELWQGLAQVAVGLTHAQRGNARGAVALLRRGAGRVGRYSAAGPHGIDAAGIVRSASGLADLIERDGLSAVPPDGMLVRLRAAGYPDSASG